jgi:hypothetical protein
MKIIRILLADVLFILGNKLVILSAYIMGYKDTFNELKDSQAHWLKNRCF